MYAKSTTKVYYSKRDILAKLVEAVFNRFQRLKTSVQPV